MIQISRGQTPSPDIFEPAAADLASIVGGDKVVQAPVTPPPTYFKMHMESVLISS